MYKLAALLSLLAVPAGATGLEIDVTGEANGTIVIDLFEDVAPNHVENFHAGWRTLWHLSILVPLTASRVEVC